MGRKPCRIETCQSLCKKKNLLWGHSGAKGWNWSVTSVVVISDCDPAKGKQTTKTKRTENQMQMSKCIKVYGIGSVKVYQSVWDVKVYQSVWELQQR